MWITHPNYYVSHFCFLRLFRGFPVWLKYVPRISFRTDNEPFKGVTCWICCMPCKYMLKCSIQMAMQGFTKKIVDMMKTESLFASQGGPIILSQTCFFSCVLNIENEYGPESKSFGIASHTYLNWAVQMALRLGTGRNQILLFYARFFLCV
ncbi:hypothetical protein ZIOFF_045084 [Zingiber officinale]|uniref:beta-galactosidase n=1 Tax=Zingiber officinale TaxID=94328 RepID=A0A8J5G798_ZINOF|nr:hypothetical protein ZIOFF_045084 [Zingiber officinale]